MIDETWKRGRRLGGRKESREGGRKGEKEGGTGKGVRALLNRIYRE
jgi:hypothetical protein